MITRRRLQAAVILSVTTAASVTSSMAFTGHSNIQTSVRATHEPPIRSRGRPRPSTIATSMVVSPDDILSPLLSTTAFVMQSSPLFMSATPTATALMTDPAVEAEVLTDMSHFALDMVTFFGPATAALRFFTVVGRLMAVSADYIPDHTILGEEFAFQMLMLGIASHGLYKSAMPLVASALSSTSFRDGRTYQTLFGPAGVSWSQYKAMAAVAMDWLEVDSGRIISSEEQAPINKTDDHYMYWLYGGDVDVMSQGEIIQTITRQASSPRMDEANCMALLGNMKFVRALDERNKRNNMFMRKLNKKSTKDNQVALPKTTIKAGPSGATLLRIHSSKLTMLMDNDEQLAQAIQRLLVTEMHEKLTAMLISSKNSTSVSLA